MSAIAHSSTTGDEQHLSEVEGSRLKDLELVIHDGLKTFQAVGDALAEISSKRLYREISDTFEGYCQIQWGFTRRRADQLIAAAKVVAEIEAANGAADEKRVSQNATGATENAVPENALQAAALASAPVGERAEAWKVAVETAPKDKGGKRKVTAVHVKRVVAERRKKEVVSAPTAAASGGSAAPYAAYNAGIDEIIQKLTDVATTMRRVFEMQGDEITYRYAARSFNFLATVAEVDRMRRLFEEGRVVEEKPDGTVVTERDQHWLNDKKSLEALAQPAAA